MIERYERVREAIFNISQYIYDLSEEQIKELEKLAEDFERLTIEARNS